MEAWSLEQLIQHIQHYAETDPHRALGLTRAGDDPKECFKALALRLHPDKLCGHHCDTKAAKDAFILLQQAYQATKFKCIDQDQQPENPWGEYVSHGWTNEPATDAPARQACASNGPVPLGMQPERAASAWQSVSIKQPGQASIVRDVGRGQVPITVPAGHTIAHQASGWRTWPAAAAPVVAPAPLKNTWAEAKPRQPSSTRQPARNKPAAKQPEHQHNPVAVSRQPQKRRLYRSSAPPSSRIDARPEPELLILEDSDVDDDIQVDQGKQANQAATQAQGTQGQQRSNPRTVVNESEEAGEDVVGSQMQASQGWGVRWGWSGASQGALPSQEPFRQRTGAHSGQGVSAWEAVALCGGHTAASGWGGLEARPATAVFACDWAKPASQPTPAGRDVPASPGNTFSTHARSPAPASAPPFLSLVQQQHRQGHVQGVQGQRAISQGDVHVMATPAPCVNDHRPAPARSLLTFRQRSNNGSDPSCVAHPTSTPGEPVVQTAPGVLTGWQRQAAGARQPSSWGSGSGAAEQVMEGAEGEQQHQDVQMEGAGDEDGGGGAAVAWDGSDIAGGVQQEQGPEEEQQQAEDVQLTAHPGCDVAPGPIQLHSTSDTGVDDGEGIDEEWGTQGGVAGASKASLDRAAVLGTRLSTLVGLITREQQQAFKSKSQAAAMRVVAKRQSGGSSRSRGSGSRASGGTSKRASGAASGGRGSGGVKRKQVTLDSVLTRSHPAPE